MAAGYFVLFLHLASLVNEDMPIMANMIWASRSAWESKWGTDQIDKALSNADTNYLKILHISLQERFQDHHSIAMLGNRLMAIIRNEVSH